MNAPSSSLWSVHGALWRRALGNLWRNRHEVTAVTLALWVPWRIVIPLVDRWTEFHAFAGFPLDWVADAFWEPLYGGIILVLLAERNGELQLGHACLRGMWLMPRLLLIDLKIAVWGLAAPYLVLHLGGAVLLTIVPTPAAARWLLIATVLSAAWLLVVLVRYFSASAVLVAERRAIGLTSPEEERLKGYRLWFGSGGVSTGWSLWAARQLVRGRTAQALLVLVVGNGVVAVLVGLVPPGENMLMQALNGAAMLVTAFWWAILWEFSAYCVSERARELPPSAS